MRVSTPPRALVVAGWDPTGGAGLAADLAMLTGHGVQGGGAVSAVTSQGPKGLDRLMAVPAELLRAQIADALALGAPDVVKIGLLPDAASIDAVADALLEVEAPIVLDPVLSVSAGGWRLDDEAIRGLVGRLLPRATVTTPNGPEARALAARLGVADESDGAAGRLLSTVSRAVLRTGGHDDAPDAVDVLFVGGREVARLGARRVPGGPFHGTGCALSAALAARLARGESLEKAASGAREVVRGLLRLAAARGTWRLPFALLRAGGESWNAPAGTVGTSASEDPA